MATFILTTVGTSLLGNLRRTLGVAAGELPELSEAVAALAGKEPVARECGAEVNSLALLVGQSLTSGVAAAPFEVHLLTSDTAEGRWTGELLSRHLPRLDFVRSAATETVPGLDGSDAGRFAQEGLRSLVQVSARRLSAAFGRSPAPLCVINATGGYKAQISFAGLIGQALKVPVVYLFEEFPRCIEMPPLPVDFDRSLWLENYSLFARLSAGTMLPAQDLYLDTVDDRLRRLLDFAEVDGRQFAALSPILELMHQSFRLIPPASAAPPPPTDLQPADKLHVNRKELGHSPQGSKEAMERLTTLPWVTRVENLRFLNTAARTRVKASGTEQLNEIRVIHGDGNLGLEIVLLTTCGTPAHRAWCLEELKELLAAE